MSRRAPHPEDLPQEGDFKLVIFFSTTDFKFEILEYQFLPDLNWRSMAVEWPDQFRTKAHLANFGYSEEVVRYFAKVQAGKFK